MASKTVIRPIEAIFVENCPSRKLKVLFSDGKVELSMCRGGLRLSDSSNVRVLKMR